MLDTLLEKRLKELRNEQIVVVMDDDTAFKASLEDFDESTIVLKEIFEGSASEIDWKRISKPTEEEEPQGNEHGYIEWNKIMLDKVFIRVNHVERIWPWTIGAEPAEGRYDTGPVYRRRADMSEGQDPAQPTSGLR